MHKKGNQKSILRTISAKAPQRRVYLWQSNEWLFCFCKLRYLNLFIIQFFLLPLCSFFCLWLSFCLVPFQCHHSSLLWRRLPWQCTTLGSHRLTRKMLTITSTSTTIEGQPLVKVVFTSHKKRTIKAPLPKAWILTPFSTALPTY